MISELSNNNNLSGWVRVGAGKIFKLLFLFVYLENVLVEKQSGNPLIGWT